ncbi:hypothetical protein CQW23_16788 [Capsicum baccatum]|uniref:Uncharacterized protein n=1 Tax=Capsicum baccatum TaxID=33114 RepID=A0A2G2WBY7_CAPBA|nr:hypothetical protein CQW23_16788 [Capsicum baccatum]
MYKYTQHQRPKIEKDRQKDEALKRKGVWKQSRKGKVMTCSKCGLRNHNSRGCRKHSKRGVAKQKQVVEEDPVEENINLTASYPTQESQHILDSVYPGSGSMPDLEVDDEYPLLIV